MSEPANAARAIDALRRGWPVRVQGRDGALTVIAVERADDARLADFDPDGKAELLLSAERGAILKLATSAMRRRRGSRC